MREIIVTTKKVTQASVSISKGGYHPLTPSLSFSLAQRKELKETSTLTKPSPIWEGSNDGLRKPTNHRGFWYRGTTRWLFLCLAAWGAGRRDVVFDGLAALETGRLGM